MYQIIAYETPTSDVRHVVYDPKLRENVINGKLSLIENEINNLTLTVGQENWLYGNTGTFQTHIEVYQDNVLLFRGRLLDVTREMDSGGKFTQTFVFEDVANYLKDSIQRFAKVQDTTPKQFLQDLIDLHNSQVPAYKQFELRNVEVINSTDNVYRYVDYVSTWDTIQDKLVSRLGGYIVTEYANGKNYVDYLKLESSTTHTNDTPILLKRNLKSLNVKEDPTEIITRFIPLGATIQQDTSETNGDVSSPRLTIAGVNGGSDYIDIPELQAQFGVINGTNTWDDVHDANILLTKANQWIASQVGSKESYTVSALELPNYDAFKVSDNYLVSNERVMTDAYLRVIQKDIDFNDPLNSSLTIGDKSSSLSQYQLENINAKKQARSIQDKLNASQNALDSLKTDYSVMSNQFVDMQKQIADLNGGWQAGSLFVTLSELQSGKTSEWYRNLNDDNNIAGAIIKLTQGVTFANTDFASQVGMVGAAGMTFIGAYHIFTATDEASAVKEAQYFVAQLQANSVSNSAITAAYIGEGNGLSGNKNDLTLYIDAFNAVLANAGYTNTTDYATNDWLDTRFTSNAAYKWIINTETATVPRTADAWQYNNNFNNESLPISKSYDRAFI